MHGEIVTTHGYNGWDHLDERVAEFKEDLRPFLEACLDAYRSGVERIAQALADANLLAAPIPDDVQAVLDAAVAVVAAMESDDARDLPHALVALVSAVDDRAAL